MNPMYRFAVVLFGSLLLLSCRSDPDEFSRYDSESRFYCSYCHHYHSRYHDHYYYDPDPAVGRRSFPREESAPASRPPSVRAPLPGLPSPPWKP